MHHHPGRFVDDDKIVVFMHDVQGDIFGQRFHVGGVFHSDFENVTFGNARLGIPYGRAIFDNCALSKKLRQSRARQMRLLWHIARKRLIKAGRRVGADGHTDDARHG